MSNLNTIFNTLRLGQTLRTELIKFAWNILSIKWYDLKVNIQVFESFLFSKKTKQKIFRYFKSIKKIKNLSEKFSVNSSFTYLFFKKIRIFEELNFIPFLVKNKQVFLLFHNIKRLRLFLIHLSQLNCFNWIIIELVLISLVELRKHKINLNLKKTKLNFQLQKINSFLYFKILGVLIENNLFFFVKKRIKVNISNIWQNKGWLFKLLFKDKFSLKLLFLSCIYNNTKMFSEFISLQLNKTKNHKIIIRKIILTIETFWKNPSNNLNGIQLRISGKLNGSMRKSKYHYAIGKTRFQSLSSLVNYSLSISYTKFGLISVKFWVMNRNT